jgi:beta-lactamase class D
MGYDSGVLIDESNPVFPYRPEYSTPFESWKNDQTPASWMKNSCVWCSQVMTQKMGMDKIKKYLKDFNYGNQDMSGDPGKDNGLTRAWLGSSLKISPAEQTAFIRKLVRGELPVSKESMDKTKKLAQLGTMGDGWSFYGKTGSYDLKTGWFTGWVEKGVTAYIIVMCLEDAVPMDGIMPAGGPVAKEKCRKIILESGLLK